MKEKHKRKEEDIVILWLSTDQDDFSNLNNILEEEDKPFYPLLCLSNENLNSLPSLVKEIFGHEYVIRNS